jgi:hypothetical protein
LIRIKGVLESFSNYGHRDSADCTDEEQGEIVCEYLQDVRCPILQEYFSRMHSIFNEILVRPIIPLPTTCAWKLIENPEQFSFKHI